MSPRMDDGNFEDENEINEDDIASSIGDDPVGKQDEVDDLDAEACEEAKWNNLELEAQFSEVMEDLRLNKRRWDDSGGSSTIVLEDYKKRTLANSRDYRDPTVPTALHILAKDHRKEYAKVPRGIRTTVIHFLLEAMYGKTAEVTSREQPKEQLLIKVAMTFDNDEFIDCVMDCWGDKFSDLLHFQDSEDKNCLHWLLSWPNKIFSQDTPQKKEIFLCRVKKLVSKAKPETLATPDREGNTPIHHAVHYMQCLDKPDEYVDEVKNMILKGDKIMKTRSSFNKKGQSPLLLYKSTKSDRMRQIKAKREEEEKRRNEKEAQNRLQRSEVTNQASQPNTGIFTEGREHKKVTVTGSPQADSSGFAFSEPRTKMQKYAEASPMPSYINRASTAAQNIIPPTAIGRHMAPPPPPPVGRGPEGGGQKGGDGVRTAKGKGRISNVDKTVKAALRYKAGKDIIDFLTMHYIRTRSDMDARALIFEKIPRELNLNLYFDATGHKEASKIVDLVDRMEHGGFWKTLSYVYIPTLQYTDQEREPTAKTGKKSYSVATADQGLKENPQTGRTALVSVFDKLCKAGVHNILRLYVEDREHPSHTDAAIERALQGRESMADASSGRGSFHVESWDWRKPDLSTDVIAFAAPTVETVNLYWSGNQTVLRGWGCREGIPRLHVATERRLKKVIIHAAPGLESRDRMDKALERFKRDVINNMGTKIDIEINRCMDGLFTQQDTREEATDRAGGQAAEDQHAWIEKMEEFRRALTRIESIRGINENERVKVALIDDGVDLCELDTYNNHVKVTGVSYCPREGSSERPWHRSGDGHGTIMANMIVRVNPWVYLYVMRIQEGSSRDGNRMIYADSAARAIQGAIDLHVDIISISWTVRNKLDKGTQINRERTNRQTMESAAVANLEAAVEKVISDRKILMFCSTSDDILLSAMDTLPYQKGQKNIFRIGAASPLGQRDHHSEDEDNIDFYMPGNRVAAALNPRSADVIKYYDGSSVSTALAAGMASLIMHCAHIAHQHVEKLQGSDNRLKGLREALRQRQNMHTAFTNIDVPEWKNKKYLPVWKMFGPAAESMNAKRNDDDKLDVLVRLVQDLCHRIL